MYTLEELSRMGKAEVSIGLSDNRPFTEIFASLNAQMDMRGMYAQIDIARELRLPALVQFVDKYGGKDPSRFNVTEEYKDIITRKPKRRLIVKTGQSKKFIKHEEAEFCVEEEKNGEWQRVPTALPGFLIANNKTELTLEDEINRSAEFISRKYLLDLPERSFTPERYTFDFKITNVSHKKGTTFGDIEVMIGKQVNEFAYKSPHEFWENYVKPMVLNSKIPSVIKKLELIQFQKVLSNKYRMQEGDIPLKRIHYSINIINRLLDKKIKEDEEGYTRLIGNLETDSYELKLAEKVYAKNILEKTVKPEVLSKLYDHEDALKFDHGKKYILKVKQAELMYE